MTRPDARYHSLDALRAIMMLLGLVLHGGASYVTVPIGAGWPYHDRSTHPAFDVIVFFIHIFRMPVFFVAAGFFAALLHERDGPRGFTRNRIRRVLLPLVIFWAALLPPVAGGFAFAEWRATGTIAGEAFRNVRWWDLPVLMHLWFLYHLLILYAAALVIVPVVRGLPEAWRVDALRHFGALVSMPAGALAFAAATTLTLLPMRIPALETSAALVPPLRVLAAYAVFFTFGWLLFRRRDLLHSFTPRWKLMLAAGITAAGVYLYLVVETRFQSAATTHAAAVCAAAVSMWLLAYGILGGFVRYFTTGHPIVRYLSDASYWIYLVHLPLTIWVTGLLAPSPLPAGVKFAVVVGVTALVATAAYHAFVRSTAIGQLLNGKRIPDARGSIAGR